MELVWPVLECCIWGLETGLIWSGFGLGNRDQVLRFGAWQQRPSPVFWGLKPGSWGQRPGSPRQTKPCLWGLQPGLLRPVLELRDRAQAPCFSAQEQRSVPARGGSRQSPSPGGCVGSRQGSCGQGRGSAEAPSPAFGGSAPCARVRAGQQSPSPAFGGLRAEPRPRRGLQSGLPGPPRGSHRQPGPAPLPPGGAAPAAPLRPRVDPAPPPLPAFIIPRSHEAAAVFPCPTPAAPGSPRGRAGARRAGAGGAGLRPRGRSPPGQARPRSEAPAARGTGTGAVGTGAVGTGSEKTEPSPNPTAAPEPDTARPRDPEPLPDPTPTPGEHPAS
ncbi:uncharacterized protein FN964_003727 [Alca torda]